MEEKQYEELFDTFSSKGWKLFIGNVKEIHQLLESTAADGADTNDKWQFCRGQIMQLRAILGYEKGVRMAYNQMKEDKALELFEAEDEPNVDVI